MRQNRRSFLATLGAAAMGAAFRPRSAAAAAAAARFGVQLYTLRSEMRRGVEAVLARVAQIGFTEVEFAGYFDHSPSQIRNMLERTGLTSPSTHIGFAEMRDAWSRTLDDVAAIGHTFVTVPWLPREQRTSIDDVKRTAALFNERAAQARTAGIGFAYHNHDFEFVPIGDVVPYDVLLEETEPDLVSFQADVFWMLKAGCDPVECIARHPGRFTMTHLKDSGGSPAHTMQDVGSGVIDFARVIAAAEAAGAHHHFVEHDEPADPFASIRSSHRHLARLNL